MLAGMLGVAQTAYIPNNADTTVSVVDVTTNTVVANIIVGHRPLGVSVSLDGSSVYIANQVDSTISVINT